MKTIKLILLAFLTMSLSCEPDEQEPIQNCNCEKQLFLWTPPINSIGIFIPARYEYVKSIYNQCGETTIGYTEELGSDYNRYKLICE